MHEEDKLPTRSSAVLIGLPLALRYLPFTTIGALYRVLGARKKFNGKEKNNMKRTNEVTATDGAILLRTLQAGFGCAAVFIMSKEAYLWPTIALRHRRLASFTEGC